ncbi:hypothetical protein [Paraclostridium sordellii]|uniref:hypothetical protein n=1 Tax=Paraclostridium sordellii TaxID=1505 RepID=UPI0018C3444C|nr:hypothetical protein [Paeniclostridium sordellii]
MNGFNRFNSGYLTSIGNSRVSLNFWNKWSLDECCICEIINFIYCLIFNKKRTKTRMFKYKKAKGISIL